MPENSPASWMVTMFSWLNWAVARASARNRSRNSFFLLALECRNLMATLRPSRVSWAAHTVPMPPRPSFRMSSYLCTMVPGASWKPSTR